MSLPTIATKRQAYFNVIANHQALIDGGDATTQQLTDSLSACTAAGLDYTRELRLTKNTEPGLNDDDYFTDPLVITEDLRRLVKKANGIDTRIIHMLSEFIGQVGVDPDSRGYSNRVYSSHPLYNIPNDSQTIITKPSGWGDFMVAMTRNIHSFHVFFNNEIPYLEILNNGYLVEVILDDLRYVFDPQLVPSLRLRSNPYGFLFSGADDILGQQPVSAFHSKFNVGAGHAFTVSVYTP